MFSLLCGPKAWSQTRTGCTPATITAWPGATTSPLASAATASGTLAVDGRCGSAASVPATSAAICCRSAGSKCSGSQLQFVAAAAAAATGTLEVENAGAPLPASAGLALSCCCCCTAPAAAPPGSSGSGCCASDLLRRDCRPLKPASSSSARPTPAATAAVPRATSARLRPSPPRLRRLVYLLSASRSGTVPGRGCWRPGRGFRPSAAIASGCNAAGCCSRPADCTSRLDCWPTGQAPATTSREGAT